MTDEHAAADHKYLRRCRVSVSRQRLITVAGLPAAALSCWLMQSAPAMAAELPPPAPAGVQDAYRPQFHFTPPSGWMNDPCGMFYYDGHYHLHYLWNPDLGGWGQQWANVTSKDLIHWTAWPASVKCVGSGSGLVDTDNTSGFKTGKHSVPVLVFTDFASEGQIVGLAYSNDRGRSWTNYAHNPVLRRPNENKDFRDPEVFWLPGWFSCSFHPV